MRLEAPLVGLAMVALGLVAPNAIFAQAHDHPADDHADHMDTTGAGHEHTDPVVDCTTLGSPPWSGLSDQDRRQVAELRDAVAGLSTPEAAEAAGFRPALGDIPGMGVHYVNRQRTQDGVHADAPDHLLFAQVGGEQKLVGVAYAFVDVPDTDEPIPFHSDLAHWHDHPQFAPAGQTLHMLHVWFVPSSNGPFAGLNYWLPFEERGLARPSACWMADPAVAERIKSVSFALVRPGSEVEQSILGDRALAADPMETPGRESMLSALDAAARAQDEGAWTRAADRLLGDLTPRERMRSQAFLRVLTNAQMSSSEREEQSSN